MANEEDQDAVLCVLCAADQPLSVEEIGARAQPSLEPRQVRIALRELAERGDALKGEDGRWKAPRPPPEAKTRGAQEFTDDELRRAREQHGTVTSCPKCGKQGDIDALFGWRRMKPGRDQIHPQSWCLECRQTSWRKAPQR